MGVRLCGIFAQKQKPASTPHSFFTIPYSMKGLAAATLHCPRFRSARDSSGRLQVAMFRHVAGGLYPAPPLAGIILLREAPGLTVPAARDALLPHLSQARFPAAARPVRLFPPAA